MKFCPTCGSDKLILEIPKGDNRQRHVCKNCNEIHYSNPKIITGCLPIWKDKILLAKRSIEPRVGYWNVPSGFMENGETVEDGAAREVWEEALGKVKIIGVHSVFSIARINQVYIHFLGELEDGKFGIGEESSDCQLFTESEIPWRELAFYSSAFSLQSFFEDRKNGVRNVHIENFSSYHKKVLSNEKGNNPFEFSKK